ncbi:hypothetical protein [Aeromonas hydrophila]|uniref:Glycosyltransferase n=1 Tax=Aeromonas hydrophila TaxID=644 RepID=A0AAX3P1Y6_AERHY|nr:hypothetical protein [Aeromonas hydrophila]WEE24630.1 hypothetical protein PY771_13165 [Aeromonas hydrophila]
MQINKASIDIYSDVDYLGYQHVNQMLFHYALNSGYESRFFHRIYMNYPSLKRLVYFFRAKKNNDRFRLNGNVNAGVKVIKNYPSFNFLTDKYISHLINDQIERPSNYAITFVPSKALERVFSGYEKIFYYCVHDSINQTYPVRNKAYEKKLVKDSRVIFCDNHLVAKRLVGELPCPDICDVSKHDEISLIAKLKNGCKCFIVPPPVPDEFFHVKSSCVGDEPFDFVYFGSIHKDIEQSVFYELDKKCFKILIISSDRLDSKLQNVAYIDAISDVKILCQKIALSKRILLPYKNSEFMLTVSPAKIYQSLATGKSVWTSNTDISSKFNIPMIHDYSERYVYSAPENLDSFHANSLLKKVLLIIDAC